MLKEINFGWTIPLPESKGQEAKLVVNANSASQTRY